jgi:Rod binding domain-containing protein
MSADYSLSAVSPLSSLDLAPNLAGASEQTKIKQVSKAMESLFVNQLTKELGKSIDGTDDVKEGPYSDFIQQAMTEGVNKAGGLGLAKIIEDSLNQREHPKLAGHMKLETKNTSYHVNHVE